MKVAVLMSGAATPIARQVELGFESERDWRRVGGHCMHDGNLHPSVADAPLGSGIFGTQAGCAEIRLVLKGDGSPLDSTFDRLKAKALLVMKASGGKGALGRLLALWL